MQHWLCVWASTSGCNHLVVFIRPVTSWVRCGWSPGSVRTPCQDTFSSSFLERRHVLLYVLTPEMFCVTTATVLLPQQNGSSPLLVRSSFGGGGKHWRKDPKTRRCVRCQLTNNDGRGCRYPGAKCPQVSLHMDAYLQWNPEHVKGCNPKALLGWVTALRLSGFC